MLGSRIDRLCAAEVRCDAVPKLDKELTWLATMRDEGVRRIAARTVGLSAQAQDDVAATVEELRRRQHLDE